MSPIPQMFATEDTGKGERVYTTTVATVAKREGLSRALLSLLAWL
jgi:hypothetical protein